MNILFLSQGDKNDTSTEHRVLWAAEGLEKRGHSCSVYLGFTYSINNRKLRMISPKAITKILLDSFDVVIMNRDASPIARIVQIICKNKNIPLLYDFDDAIQTTRNIEGTLIPNPTRYHLDAILTNADYITTGASPLATFAKQYNPNVSCNRTPVNCSIFNTNYSSPREYDKPVIGWMGSGPNHIRNLKILADPLEELANEHDFIFRLVSALSEDVKEIFSPLEDKIEIEYGFNGWRPITDIATEMQTFDISVCPLSSDDEYMQGKSSMKVLENMATKTPVIASDFGAYSRIIDHGDTGLLANSTEDWINCLQILLENQTYRQELASAGYRLVRDKHTVNEYIDELENILYNKL